MFVLPTKIETHYSKNETSGLNHRVFGSILADLNARYFSRIFLAKLKRYKDVDLNISGPQQIMETTNVLKAIKSTFF